MSKLTLAQTEAIRQDVETFHRLTYDVSLMPSGRDDLIREREAGHRICGHVEQLLRLAGASAVPGPHDGEPSQAAGSYVPLAVAERLQKDRDALLSACKGFVRDAERHERGEFDSLNDAEAKAIGELHLSAMKRALAAAEEGHVK